VRGDDLGFVRDAERLQKLGSLAHRVPVGPASHDNPDQRRFVCHATLLCFGEAALPIGRDHARQCGAGHGRRQVTRPAGHLGDGDFRKMLTDTALRPG
jgi:hypothetical protein